MRLLLFSDNHFCEKYSLMTGYGSKYSLRLENQLATMNWLEQLAIDNKVDGLICLGDFFDRAELTDQELTAVRDIKWNGLPHYFLVGNHESEENDLQYSSTKALEGKNRKVICEPTTIEIDSNCDLLMLPYIVESNKQPLSSYFSSSKARKILLSHNDLFGIQMGPVISRQGFEPKEIEATCDLCFNGHLHNGQKITNKIINLGNITGKDFGEDASKYPHMAVILDTDTLKYEYIKNPFALNFYRIEIASSKDISKISKLKNNSIVSVKCLDTLVPELRTAISNTSNIIGSRIMAVKPVVSVDAELDLTDLTIDHLKKFYEICHEKINNDDILEQELAEVLK